MRDENGYITCDHCGEVEDVWALDLDGYGTDRCVNCIADAIKDLPNGADTVVKSVKYKEYADGSADRYIFIDGEWSICNGGLLKW